MIKEQAIYYRDEFIINLNDIKVVGNHNIQNIMTAICIAKKCGVLQQSSIEKLPHLLVLNIELSLLEKLMELKSIMIQKQQILMLRSLL